MPQIINTNIASVNAQRNLDRSQAANQIALQRLSSGLRINSAKDDAAGLAISTRFTSQVRGLNVAIRNANDGVSLAQTAEGALGAMTENLLRIRDLALQSANATNSAIDREALNQEVQQLKEEIQRIADQTNFNGTKLLDGTFTDVTFQIGPNEGESVTFGINGATTDQLGTALNDGISSDPVSFTTGTPTAPTYALGAGDLVINGIAVPASTGVDDSFSNLDNERSAIAKAAAINKVTEQTGVKAIVNQNSVGGTKFSTPASDISGNIKINGISISVSVSKLLSDQVNLENVASAINEKSGQTGVTAIFDGNPTKGIQLVAADGRNIILTGDGTNDTSAYGLATSGGASASQTYAGTFTLVSTDGSDIQLDTTTGTIKNAGLQVGTFSGSNSGLVSQEQPAAAMATGDLVINGVPVGPSLASDDSASPTATSPAQSAIAKAAAINKVADQTGVTAVVNASILNGDASIGGVGSAIGGSFDVNGVTINVAWSAADSTADVQRTIVTAVNNKSGQSGVRAEAFGNSFRLIADDGRNVLVNNFTGLTAANVGLSGGTSARGSVTLLSAGKIQLDTLTGNISNAGFEVGAYGSATDGQLIRDVDISTVDGAIKALAAVDNALQKINFQRAQLGAIQNRFESTVANQAIVAENLQAANSRIRDADFAAETAELSRTQVLQQAGLSILAQANGQPQQVLQLLQG
ncbi:flagellin [Hahella sp. SMD15-11]|uniref:Flagellin n=1 Tax=Thermohahella caldifontis TaxID=3142973 RepID=A0AB39UYX9_9GAMM